MAVEQPDPPAARRERLSCAGGGTCCCAVLTSERSCSCFWTVLDIPVRRSCSCWIICCCALHLLHLLLHLLLQKLHLLLHLLDGLRRSRRDGGGAAQENDRGSERTMGHGITSRWPVDLLIIAGGSQGSYTRRFSRICQFRRSFRPHPSFNRRGTS